MADITRAEVASLIGEEFGPNIIKTAIQGSAALSALPKVNMGTKLQHLPVLATLPEAGWVNDTDNTGAKPTSKATWGDVTLSAEEIAVIIPVHENTLADASESILTEISGLGGQAIGKTLDLAIIFGTNKPASWTSPALLPAAVAAGQTYQATAAAGKDDLYGSALQAAGYLADEGFEPTALLAKRSLRYQLANIRDNDGNPILDSSTGAIGGFDTTYSRNGGWDASSATAFLLDPTTARIGVRQDVTVKLLDQATVGGINLAEKDMVALRFKARFAYVLAKVATSEGPDKTSVAAIAPKAA